MRRPGSSNTMEAEKKELVAATAAAKKDDLEVEDDTSLLPQNHHHASSSSSTRHPPLSTTTLSAITERLVSFWYADLPPLYGPLRLAFYGLMWFVTLDIFPYPSAPHKALFQVASCVSNRDELLHFSNLNFEYNKESGIFGWFLSYIDDPSTFWLFHCQGLVEILQISIVLSAVGFGWKIPRILTAVTYWIMLMMKQSTWRSQNTHSTLLGAFAFVSLCFAENNLIDQWSIDSWLMHVHRQNWPQQPSRNRQQPYILPTATGGKASAGGAARKFVMGIAAVAFFFAGIHKIAEVSWLGWLDGRTLKDAIREQSGHWYWLNHIFTEYDFLCVPLAVITIVGEVGVVAILLSKWWRPFGIATLYMFHIGVFLLLDPNFICHCIDYFLIIEWKAYYERFFRRKTSNGDQEESGAERGSSLDEENLSPSSVSLSPSSPMSICEIPTSWKVGSWIYTIVVVMAFLAGLFRVDGMPFYSWCLYNHHPTDVVKAQPFIQETIEYAAHKCLTTPPINPACQHLGNYRHHDNFKDFLRRRGWTIAIVADRTNPSCPIGVYKDWMLLFCSMNYFTNPQYLVPQTDQDLIFLDSLVKRAAEMHFRSSEEPESLPMAKINMGLRRWYIDAMASAIDDGTACFREDARWTQGMRRQGGKTYLSGDYNPYNAASRFARQVRTAIDRPGMTELYLGENKKILSLSLSFSYFRQAPMNKTMPWLSDINICQLGTSVDGENVGRTWGNFEIGNPKPNLPPGDYSKVWTEVFYILGLGFVIAYGPRWRETTSNGLRFMTSNKMRRHRAATSAQFQKNPFAFVMGTLLHFTTKFQVPIFLLIGFFYLRNFHGINAIPNMN